MKYCKATTESHPLATSYQDSVLRINDLVEREDETNTVGLQVFTDETVVIDLDAIESIVAVAEKREREQSMDMVFGTSDDTAKNIEMVAVEIKLNYVNSLRNLKKDDIEGKIRGSIALLDSSVPVCPNFYFVFSDKLIGEAINKLYRYYPDPKIRQTRKAETIYSLKSAFFD